MKKLFSILVLALAVVACQNEDVANVKNDDLAMVTLNITASELDVTRAEASGKDSSVGAIDYADAAFWAEYDLRYILEVRGEDGVELIERISDTQDSYDVAAPMQFSLRLIPNRTYQFVVWADFVEQGSEDNLYYNADDLTKIVANTSHEGWVAMNEARDAYFASEDIAVTTQLNTSITLQRPLAKVRVVTTDIDEIAGYEEATRVVVNYSSEATLSKEFNAVSGDINNAAALDELNYDVTYATALSKYDAAYDAANAESKTLFTDYLFVKPAEDGQTDIQFVMDVYGKGGAIIKSNDFNTQIPIKRNHLTTIIGELLTTSSTLNILISDDFDNELTEIVEDGDADSDTVEATPEQTTVSFSNGKYSIPMEDTDGSSFTLELKQALSAGTYLYGEDFTVSDYKYATPAVATRSEAATVDATVTGGTMYVTETIADGETTFTIVLDLDFSYTEGDNVVEESSKYRVESKFEFAEVPALAAPADLKATVADGKVTITWKAVANAASYDVIFGETSENVEATTYTFDAPDKAGNYTVKVVAKPAQDADFVASVASEVSFTIEEKVVITPLAKPVVKAEVEGNVVTLSWAAVENAASYSVAVDEAKATSSDKTTYEFVGEYATEYKFTVVAVSGNKELYSDSEAAIVTATTDEEQGEEPTPEVEAISVEDFLAAEVNDEVIYELTGVITSITNTQYGNFYLKDESGEVYVYGVDLGESGLDWSGDANLNVGDTITIWGCRSEYNGTAQVKGAIYKSHVDGEAPEVVAKRVTVAEFLAAAEDNVAMYELSGTITSVANTLYGNFDLTDDTGTVYIYGLCSPEGAQKYWAESGAQLGDDITIQTIRTSYGNTPQGKNAIFVELTSPGTRAFWSFSKTSVSFAAVGGEEVIDVEAYNLTGAVECSSNSAQFSVVYDAGKLTVTAKENTSTDSISGIVTVKSGSLSQEIAIKQGGVVVGGGTEVVAEAVMKDFGWANAAAVTEAKLDDNVIVTFAQGGASTAPAYYTSGEAVRLYQNGATMTVSASGKTIKSMEITFANKHYYMAPDCGEFSEEAAVRTWTGEATEVMFTSTGTDKDHRAYISAIKVTYID